MHQTHVCTLEEGLRINLRMISPTNDSVYILLEVQKIVTDQFCMRCKVIGHSKDSNVSLVWP